MKKCTRNLIFCIAAPLIVGGLSALLTKDSMIMFDYVKKPPLTPPTWLFPVVWTLLYALMGLASYLVLTAKKQSRTALIFYAVQLVFNFFWSIIFFDLGDYLFALIWLLALLTLIVITTVQFYKLDKKAGFLLLPYILWVSFAGYLNYGIYMFN